jgi:hypothetical protein
MRILLPFVVLVIGGCEEGTSEPCPEGELSEADLPCDCHGADVESLSCGALVCSAAGLATTGDGTTGDCTSTTAR